MCKCCVCVSACTYGCTFVDGCGPQFMSTTFTNIANRMCLVNCSAEEGLVFYMRMHVHYCNVHLEVAIQYIHVATIEL